MLKICHLSDLHIRNFRYHDEYLKHFDNLYKSIKSDSPDIIVITGDILHQKTTISPELIRICSAFLKNLSAIASVHVIPGNHDGNLNNLTRLDALTPIIESMENKNIFFYKKSGIYSLNDMFDFVVFSCFEDETQWPTEQDIDKNKVRVGLFHGMVRGAALQNGQIVDETAHSLRKFLDVVDYLMLGDIHEKQILDLNCRAAYAGSIIQQNFGESLSKGYLVWEIEDKKNHKVDFTPLPPVCPFYTIELDDSLSLTKQKLLPQSRIRVLSRQLTLPEKKLLTDQIKQLYNPYELFFIDDESASRQQILIDSKSTISDVSDTFVQETMIRNYLQRYSLSENMLNKIAEINVKYNSLARSEDDVLRNIQYRINRMSFSNTFSFGEGNELNFDKYRGLLGIFGKNAVGKSTVAVDVPLYSMFNRVSKKGVVKNDLIINDAKDNCAAEIEIDVGNSKYIINRSTNIYLKTGKSKGEPVFQGKTEVDFKRFQNGIEFDENDTERSETDKKIRKIFGSAEDFMATSVAPQWSMLGLIDAGGTDRQKLIGRYFDIDIFETKHKLAKDDIKEIKGKLKIYTDRNFEQEIKNYEQDLYGIKKEYETAKSLQQQLENKTSQLDDKILSISSKIIAVQLGDDCEKIDERIKNLENSIQTHKTNLQVYKNALEDLEKTQKDLERNDKNIDIESQQKLLFQHSIIQKDISTLKEKISLLGTTEKDLDNTVCRLKDYPCIKNEDCCIKKELDQTYVCKSKNTTQISVFKDQIVEKEKQLGEINIDSVNNNINTWNRIQKDKTKIQTNKASQNERIKKSEISLTKDQERLKSLYLSKKEYEKNKKQIENNKLNQAQLNELTLRKNICQTQYKESIEQVNVLSTKIGSLTTLLNNSIQEKQEYDNLKQEYEAYDYFIRSMAKDGIVKQIISNNLNIINKEIEKILSQSVNFSIELESNSNGKEIEIYFKHEKSRKRCIELCSGFEKTMAAIAIRAALISVTTLPKSNLFVLDEVFTFLDAEGIDSIYKMLEYLKQKFETVIVITHIDKFKDVVDYAIEITRNSEGFSIINE